MKRKTFLQSIGVAGVGLTVTPALAATNKDLTTPPTGVCVLIPSETAGPFPLDLTDNAFYFRQDVTEDRVGVAHRVRLKIIGLTNCLPMQNVRVNIWHCDKDGNYSGYGTQAGQTYLRGYQITDIDGMVEFITIFPGWYPGRVCHVHFQVHVNTAYSAVSQWTYDHLTKTALYNDNAAIYTEGADPLAPTTDGIFADGYQYQLATLQPDLSINGFESYLEVGVQGSGTPTGFAELQAAKYMTLGQNQPNPMQDKAIIPFELKMTSQVVFEFFDLQGRSLGHNVLGTLPAGHHTLPISFHTIGVVPGHMAYQMRTTNADGQFVLSRMVTYMN
jgi:protocatechuate 3,4-dioxygenase beta subunit